MVKSILDIDKERLQYFLDKYLEIFDIFNKTKLNTQEIFFLTSKLADSYHE
jgi:hypothetical protein